MNDRCESCGHDWHGAAKCGAAVAVDVVRRTYFTSGGAGPRTGWDVVTLDGRVETRAARCSCPHKPEA